MGRIKDIFIYMIDNDSINFCLICNSPVDSNGYCMCYTPEKNEKDITRTEI